MSYYTLTNILVIILWFDDDDGNEDGIVDWGKEQAHLTIEYFKWIVGWRGQEGLRKVNRFSISPYGTEKGYDLVVFFFLSW